MPTTDQTLLARLREIRQGMRTNASAISQNLQPIALALTFIEKNYNDTLPIAAILSENTDTPKEYEKERAILLLILKAAINLRLEEEAVKCAAFDSILLRSCYLQQYNSIIADSRPLREIHAAATNLDIVAKFLQGRLHGQEWLTDIDLAKLADKCGLKNIMHFCPLDASNIGLILHFARKTAATAGTNEYVVPILLNLGNKGDVINQGTHWTRLLFVVNTQDRTISVKFRDTIACSAEKIAQIKAELQRAVQYRESSQVGNSRVLYEAFPDYTMTFDVAADDVADRQTNGWECGYLACQRLLKDEDFLRLHPIPALEADQSLAQKQRKKIMDSHDLRATVYETLLSSLSVSPVDLANVQLADKEQFFAPSSNVSDAQAPRPISQTNLARLIQNIGTVTPSSGGAALSLENLQVEERATTLATTYQGYIDTTQSTVTLDLARIFPENAPNSTATKPTDIEIKARLRALVNIINNDSHKIKLLNIGYLPEKAPKNEQVQLELDGLIKPIAFDAIQATENTPLPDSYKYLQIIQARNELIELLGIKDRIDPKSNIWHQLWLARIADASLYGAVLTANDQLDIWSYYATAKKVNSLVAKMEMHYLQGLFDCLDFYKTSFENGARFPYTRFAIDTKSTCTHAKLDAERNTIKSLEKDSFLLLQKHLEIKKHHGYFPFSSMFFCVNSFDANDADGRFEAFLNLLKTLPPYVKTLELTLYEFLPNTSEHYTQLTDGQYKEIQKIFQSNQDLTVELILPRDSNPEKIVLENIITHNRRTSNIKKRAARTPQATTEESTQPDATSLPKFGGRRYKASKTNKLNYEISVEVEQQAEQQHQQQTQIQQEQQQQTQVQQQQMTPVDDLDSSTIKGSRITYSQYITDAEQNYLLTIATIGGTKCHTLAQRVQDSTASLRENEGLSEYWMHAISSSKGELPNSIVAITTSALNQLGTNPQVFIGGLNIDNLPPGFFVQRGEEGLILNYDPVRYIENKNKSPLTIMHDTTEAAGIDWRGSDEQFFNSQSSEKTEDFHEIYQNGTLIYNRATLDIFEKFAKGLNNDLATQIFAKHAWCLAKNSAMVFQAGKNATALIDLLYHEGCEGVVIFLDALKTLYDNNPILYSAFKETFIDKKTIHTDASISVMPLMTEENLTIIKNLAKLCGPEAAWWIELTKQHGKQITHIDLAQLYNGFQYFLQQLPPNAPLPIVCPIQNSNNMLATMDRLLAILSKVNPRNLRDQMNSLAGLDFTQDGAWYAARWERFKFFHKEMHLSPKDINKEFEIQILKRAMPTYKVGYEQLRQVAQTVTNETTLAITTTQKSVTTTSNVPIDISYPIILFHRFIGGCDKISNHYNLYVELTTRIAAANIPLQLKTQLLALFALTTTGDRGYNFTIQECEELINLIASNVNPAKFKFILNKLVTQLGRLEAKPSVTELTCLIKLIAECEWHDDIEQIIETLLDNRTLSPKIWQAITVWASNKEQIEADDFLDTFVLLKDFDSEHFGELLKIAGLLRTYRNISAATAIEQHLIPALDELKKQNAAIYEKAIQILSCTNLQDTQTNHRALPTVDDLTTAIVSLTAVNISNPGLVFAHLKSNKVLKNCSFDIAGNLDIPPFDFNSAVLAKIAELNELLRQNGLSAISLERLNDASDDNVKRYITEVAEATTKAVKDRIGSVAWFAAENTVCRKIIEGLKGILFTDIAQIRENFPVLYTALQSRFAEPKIKGGFANLADDYITLRNYPATIKDLLATLVSLQKKWSGFATDLFLNSPVFAQLSAKQLENIFKELNALDISYLPKTLFTSIFDDQAWPNNHLENLTTHIITIIGLQQFNISQKAKIITAIVAKPDLADTLIGLFTYVQTHHTTIANQIFDLFANTGNAFNANLIQKTTALLTLLENPKYAEIKSIIFTKLINNFAEYQKLLVYLDSIATNQQKLNFLTILTRSCLEHNYTKENSSAIFGDNSAADTSIAKKLTYLPQDTKLMKLYAQRPYPQFAALQTFLAATKSKSESEQSTFLTKFPLDPPGQRRTAGDITKQFALATAADRIDGIFDMHLDSMLPLSEREELYQRFLYVNTVGSTHNLRIPQTSTVTLASVADYQKPAKDLTKEQIQTLIKHYRKIISANTTPAKIKTLAQLEFVTLIREAMYRTTGRLPYSTQIISLLNTMMHSGNSFSEIRTGEGKGLITCLYAMSLWMQGTATQGHAVDVCSSNIELSKRDLQENRDFYEYLGIPTALISAQSAHNAYQQDGINYSTVSQLALFQERMELENQQLAPKASLVLDECDFSVLDDTTQFRFATSLDPSYDPHFNPNAWAYPVILDFVNANKNNIEAATGVGVSAADLQEFARNSNKLTADQKATFSRFSDIQLYKWIGAADTAMRLQEQEDFVVRNSKMTIEGQEVPIQIAQVKSHHRVTPGSQYSDGIHQFLHTRLNLEIEQHKRIGHKFPIEPEKTYLASRSAKNFVDNYLTKGNILGLTGTVGSPEEIAEMRAKYSFGFFRIPPHQQLRRIDHAPIIATESKGLFSHKSAKENYLQKIKETVLFAIQRNQPVLLICENVAASQEIFGFLQQDKEIKKYLQIYNGEQQDAREEDVIAAAGQNKMVTVTTPMLGRGTDIKPESTHGLCVVDTFIAASREFGQKVGRAGRNGNKGDSFLILSADDFAKYGKKIPKSNEAATVLNEIRRQLNENKRKEREEKQFVADIKEQCLQDYIKTQKAIKTKIDAALNPPAPSVSAATAPSSNAAIATTNEIWRVFQHEAYLLWEQFLRTFDEKWKEINESSTETLEDKIKKLTTFANSEWGKTLEQIKANDNKIFLEKTAQLKKPATESTPTNGAEEALQLNLVTITSARIVRTKAAPTPTYRMAPKSAATSRLRAATNIDDTYAQVGGLERTEQEIKDKALAAEIISMHRLLLFPKITLQESDIIGLNTDTDYRSRTLKEIFAAWLKLEFDIFTIERTVIEYGFFALAKEDRAAYQRTLLIRNEISKLTGIIIKYGTNDNKQFVYDAFVEHQQEHQNDSDYQLRIMRYMHAYQTIFALSTKKEAVSAETQLTEDNLTWSSLYQYAKNELEKYRKAGKWKSSDRKISLAELQENIDAINNSAKTLTQKTEELITALDTASTAAYTKDRAVDKSRSWISYRNVSGSLFQEAINNIRAKAITIATLKIKPVATAKTQATIKVDATKNFIATLDHLLKQSQLDRLTNLLSKFNHTALQNLNGQFATAKSIVEKQVIVSVMLDLLKDDADNIALANRFSG